jgi:hypothetical protein
MALDTRMAEVRARSAHLPKMDSPANARIRKAPVLTARTPTAPAHRIDFAVDISRETLASSDHREDLVDRVNSDLPLAHRAFISRRVLAGLDSLDRRPVDPALVRHRAPVAPVSSVRPPAFRLTRAPCSIRWIRTTTAA